MALSNFQAGHPGPFVGVGLGNEVGQGRYKSCVVVPHPVRQAQSVAVAVGMVCPTQEHGQVIVLSSRHAGSAQKEAPGGGGETQPDGRMLVVTVGQDGGDGGPEVG